MVFSVCMSVYHGDNPEYFAEALKSIFTQTTLPNEVVLVVDGPVSEAINRVIDRNSSLHSQLNVVRLNKNSGHAIARQTGVNASKNEYIAIMDSDDIAERDRFEKQMSYLERNPNIDILGGQIKEFISSIDNIVGERKVPLTDVAIKQYIKYRCPMNQVTVMFKKSSVLKAGGYQDWFWNEDYYLWIRMAINNCQFANLDNTLCRVRVGKDMYRRRGGKKYFQSERRLQKYMLQHHLITVPLYIYNVLIRWSVQVVMPNWLREWAFQNLFRKRVHSV